MRFIFITQSTQVIFLPFIQAEFPRSLLYVLQQNKTFHDFIFLCMLEHLGWDFKRTPMCEIKYGTSPGLILSWEALWVGEVGSCAPICLAKPISVWGAELGTSLCATVPIFPYIFSALTRCYLSSAWVELFVGASIYL